MAFSINPWLRNLKNSGWQTIALLCLFLTLFRLIFTGVMGLMPQDAYYFFYSQHPDLSYYDHPPMIAYLLRLFTGVFGKHVFAIKLTDFVVTLFTIVAFFQLSKQFLSGNKPLKATAILISTFMISILSLVSTPDVPLMLCWTLSLIFLQKAILKNKKTNWIPAGFMTGLCFDSKYTALFLIVGLICFLMVSRPYRKFLISGWFFLYLICFVITILPVIIWNAHNGFASFKFQSEGRVQEGLQINPSGFFGVLGHQSAILLPLLFFSFCYLLYRFLKKYGIRFAQMPQDQLFLLSFFIPLFLGFIILSFVYWVKLNWIMPAYISGIIWICRYWKMKWIRIQLFFSAILHVILALEVIFYIVPVESDDTWYGWQELSEKADSVQKKYPGSFIFSADDYKTSAILNFYLDEMVYSKNVVGERALQFDFIGTDLNQLNGKNAIFINSNPRFKNTNTDYDSLAPNYYARFRQIIPLDPILIKRNGKVVRKFSVFLCMNYHHSG